MFHKKNQPSAITAKKYNWNGKNHYIRCSFQYELHIII